MPLGVFLSPSEADSAAYDAAPIALTWATSHNGDTVAWQGRARKKLRELLGVSAVPLPKEALPVPGQESALPGGVRRRTVYLPVALRRHVPVTIVWSATHAREVRPVMLCLQGHTSGAHISWGESRVPIDNLRLENGGDYAIQAVAHGYVAVCIEQIAFGERSERCVAHRWDHPCVDACNRALLLGRTVLGDRVCDVSATIDWLNSEPFNLPAFDARTIYAMGNSAGGETALFTAAMDDRISAVIASGCVGSYRTTSGTRRTCPDTILPGMLNWLEYEDIVALCAPRRVLVVSGRDDHIYPFNLAERCVEAARPAFAALGAENCLHAVSGQAGHRFYPEIAWPIFIDLINGDRA